MKSVPKNTPVTPSTSNRRRASGEDSALAGSVKSTTPRAMTSRPGRNFRVAGFGVCSVWMNILRFLPGSPAIGCIAIRAGSPALSLQDGPRLPAAQADGAGSLEQDVGDFPELGARAQQKEPLRGQVTRHQLTVGRAVDDHPRLQGGGGAKALQGLSPGARQLALADDVGEVGLQRTHKQVISVQTALVGVEQIVRRPVRPELG